MVIEPFLPEIVELVRTRRNLVLQADPGAGKTTGLPPALLPHIDGNIVVLEPRRLAARMAARRVASEMNQRPGETVGYQVRFEDVSGPDTRLRFVTEGVLTRVFLSNPRLKGIGAVILDEFHERHLDTDLALALVRRLQQTERPDLRIAVMSATIDPEPVAQFLGGAAVFRSPGRVFPLDIRHKPHSSDPLESRVASAFEELLREGLDGDVLVFLPGAAEIRKCARDCESIARRAGVQIAPLHGDLPPEEQDRAVTPGHQRKLILSTNVAESSITIEGVSAVIDSGLARVARDSPWTGFPIVRVERVSQASATQRAGRAGRLRPGRVIRLYSADDLHRRPALDSPEILRREISQTVLDLLVLDAHDLQWLEPPPAQAIAAAQDLLLRLDAVDAHGRITPTGRRMAALPLHPRLARLVTASESKEGVAVAALLSAGERLPQEHHTHGPSDLLLLLEQNWSSRTRMLVQQLSRRVNARSSRHDTDLLKAVLCAFPDRVGRRRSGDDMLLSTGGAAQLAKESCVQGHTLMVAVDIEERPDRGQPLVRLASAIEPDWLLDYFPDRIMENQRLEWDKQRERVEAIEEILYDRLVIDETRGRQPDPERAAALLADKAWEAGIRRFVDAEPLDAWMARLRFAARHSALPAEVDLRAALESLCIGLKSFAELREAAGGFIRVLEQSLPRGGKALLDELAPERIRLPNGRSTRVTYVDGQPPWIASRLQDFFGMRQTPLVANGREPVVVHLLAPNQRPVQMTTDLGGFWERLYPQVRRELSRRYPKHSWPENP